MLHAEADYWIFSMVRIESVVKLNTNNHFEKIQNKSIQNDADNSAVIKPVSVNCSVKNLQAYYLQKNISFGRLTSEHLQHGAYVDEAKNVLFNFFTFPDVKEVSVVIARELQATTNAVKKVFEITKHKLLRDASEEAGVFKLKLNPEDAQSGDKYAFEIINSNGERTICCDPYAKRKTVYFLDPQKSENGYLDAEKQYRTDKFAEVYDHHSFNWTDKVWREGKDKRRISRLSNSENNLKSFQEARILKINIATFTKEGTFDTAKTKIQKMIIDGWFKTNGEGTYNTIELMPVETSNSKGWGYDGVYKAAPLEAYGNPESLKSLVDCAHSEGINVHIDVVPNHFGTDYNNLREAGPYLGADVECGPGANFENDFRNNKHARDWVINICGLNWLRDYHFDGLRLDLTNNMHSDYTLRQFVNEINYHEKHAIITFEDGRAFETERLLAKISNEEIALDQPEEIHAKIIERYDTNNVPLDKMGANSRWSYEWEHAINDACSDKISMEDLREEMINSVKKGEVIYGARQTPDEREKNGALSEITTLAAQKLGILPRSPINLETFRGQERANKAKKVQEAAKNAQALIEAIVLGKRPESIPQELYERGIEALKYGLAQDKISIGLTASLPAPHMRMQGKLEPFYFFRKLAINPDADCAFIEAEKGYRPNEAAMKASIVETIPYSEEYREIMQKVDSFERDINELAATNKAMSSGYILENTTIASKGSSRVLGTHIKRDESEVFVVSNFKEKSYENYEIKFPQGKWEPTICSEDAKYAGSGNNIQRSEVVSDGVNKSTISLPANSFTLFRKNN